MEIKDEKIKQKDVNKLYCSTDVLSRFESITASDHNKYSFVWDVCSPIKALEES